MPPFLALFYLCFLYFSKNYEKGRERICEKLIFAILEFFLMNQRFTSTFFPLGLWSNLTQEPILESKKLKNWSEQDMNIVMTHRHCCFVFQLISSCSQNY
jgi:hypothetical protein